MLLIDTRERKASIAPLHDARTFLDLQWPEQEPMTSGQEELFRTEFEWLLEEQQNRPIDWDAINRQQREQSTRLSVMPAFLDQQVPPTQGQTPD